MSYIVILISFTAISPSIGYMAKASNQLTNDFLPQRACLLIANDSSIQKILKYM